MKLVDRKIGFALTGSFCTIDKAIEVMKALLSQGAQVYPILSEAVYEWDTRFFQANELKKIIHDLCGHEIIHSIPQAEPIGPKGYLDLLLIAPCTGNSMAKLALGITDTPVIMAAKATLRNERPVVIAPSTNDGLSNSAKNIAALFLMKNVFVVPYGQDDPVKKHSSLVAKWDQVIPACEEALEGRQLQPVLYMS